MTRRCRGRSRNAAMTPSIQARMSGNARSRPTTAVSQVRLVKRTASLPSAGATAGPPLNDQYWSKARPARRAAR